MSKLKNSLTGIQVEALENYLKQFKTLVDMQQEDDKGCISVPKVEIDFVLELADSYAKGVNLTVSEVLNADEKSKKKSVSDSSKDEGNIH